MNELSNKLVFNSISSLDCAERVCLKVYRIIRILTKKRRWLSFVGCNHPRHHHHHHRRRLRHRRRLNSLLGRYSLSLFF